MTNGKGSAVCYAYRVLGAYMAAQLCQWLRRKRKTWGRRGGGLPASHLNGDFRFVRLTPLQRVP